MAQTAWRPGKNIEILVTTAPGSGSDRTARVIQKILQEQRLIDVSAVVVNRSGGGGAAVYSLLQQKKGEAHSIGISARNLIANPIVGRGVGYRELTPIARLTGEYIAIGVRADSPLRTGKDIIAALKANPGALSFGIANSLGNSNHQAVARALQAGGVNAAAVKNVVFQSGGNAIAALLGGHVDVVPASLGVWIGPLKAGQIRLVAISAPVRVAGDFAGVPTWREQGLDAVISNWRAMVGPPGMAAAPLAFWVTVLKQITGTADWKRELEDQYLSDEFLAGRELIRYFDQEHVELKAFLTDLRLVK
ncbi:MAG: tripartite tricarboxylate transporter substrate binding protein [Betaproteobacteria bacterium]